MTVFYIADFKIDLSHSLIIKGDQHHQVEPKVLKVLLLLAQRENQVVTHQEIMEHIWQDTEVVPNALQRCIAILRKVLEDDAKNPTIIATHPRIGYRLLAPVTWSQPQSTNNEQKNAEITKANNTQSQPLLVKKQPLLIISSLVICLLLLLVYFWPNQHSKHYNQTRPLTQTDAHESHAIYSPDGAYLIFNRYAGSCKNHIWAKQLSNNAETRLTAQSGHYGAISFTQDGRELVFAAQSNCEQTTHVPAVARCWQISTLDFALALTAAQAPKSRHLCQAEQLIKPKALANHQYAFLQQNEQRYQLMHYDDLTKKVSILYQSNSDYIYHFAYAAKQQIFALFSRDKALNNTLIILDKNGNLLSRNTITGPQNKNNHAYSNASFASNGKHLIALSQHQLYSIDLDGRLQLIKTPSNNLVSVAPHPKNRSLLAVSGNKDIDIAQLNLTTKPNHNIGADINNHIKPFTSFARSKAQERHAKYQPHGDKIAFISDRSGDDQLWLWHNNEARQVTFATSHGTINQFSWSPDGKQLAWANNKQIALTDITGKTQFIKLEKPIYGVLTWYDNNQLLVQINDPDPKGLYQLNLTSGQLIPLGINHVESAWVQKNQLFYTNSQTDVFVTSLTDNSSKAHKLTALNGKAMIIKQGHIYSVSKPDNILKRYNFQGQLQQEIMTMDKFAWKITDLHNNQLLLSQFIAINHEIVTLE